MSFYITNYPQFLKYPKDPFYSDLIEKGNIIRDEKLFYIDGYIIPRMAIFDENKNQDQYDLLFDLYNKHGEKFINFVKGVFNIVIIDKNKFLIYNDRHSIKKVFTYIDGDSFFISNDLKNLKEHFTLGIDNVNAAIFCLLNHFLNGDTIFNNVTCSQPASIIKYSDSQLSAFIYWNPNELFLREEVTIKDQSDFSFFWEELVNNYVKYINPELISITLTGGNDSRMVLAPLLNKNYSLHAFSFGNPQSFDCVIANQIVQALNLDYQNYFVNSPSKDWFSDQSVKLIDIGNTLINIHRAHRNDALEKEIAFNPDSGMIFTGLMGGEYLKEPSYDDIVLPKLFHRLIKNRDRNDSINLIKDHLKKIGISTDSIDPYKIYEKIALFLEKNNHPDPFKRKFILTYYHYGCGHHSQDANIFNHHCKHVVNPFMDIDFLEKISSSGNGYVNKKKNPFNRLFHSKLYVKTTNDLAPELSKVPYAKRGQYTANDFLNKPLIYLFKRFKYLIIKDKLKYPSNFAMGNWLYQFSKEQLESIHPDVRKIFIKDLLINQLENIRLKTTEEQWHPVTNPINLSLYLKAYETHMIDPDHKQE